MKTIIFLSGNISGDFITAIKQLGYSPWVTKTFENIYGNIDFFKQDKNAKILCICNPPPEIIQEISFEEMAFSICVSSENHIEKNKYDVVFDAKLNGLERVMKIITKNK
jgi:hypothetical protein